MTKETDYFKTFCKVSHAFGTTHDRKALLDLIVQSAIETMDLTTRTLVNQYVKKLFSSIRPYKNRFIFSASCNTSIDTPWETIKYFRDAWLEYKDL